MYSGRMHLPVQASREQSVFLEEQFLDSMPTDFLSIAQEIEGTK